MKHIICLSIFLSAIACTKKQSDSEAKKVEAGTAEQKVWTSNSALEELGYHLYFEKRLSGDNSISCNTCHDITAGNAGVDGLPTSVGINGQKGERNSPTVFNAKFLSVQFWDGRAKDLAEQAKGPITNPIEMGMESHDLAIDKIKDVKGYQELFAKAFPD